MKFPWSKNETDNIIDSIKYKDSKCNSEEYIHKIEELKNEVKIRDEKLDSVYSTVSNIASLIEGLYDDGEKLKKDNSELEIIFDNVDEMIVILDKDYKIKRINKSTLNFLDVNEKDVLGKPIDSVFGCPELKNCFLLNEESEKSIFSNNFKKNLIINVKKIFNKKDELLYVHIVKDKTIEIKYKKFFSAYNELKKMISTNEDNDKIVSRLKEIMKLQEKVYNDSGELNGKES